MEKQIYLERIWEGGNNMDKKDKLSKEKKQTVRQTNKTTGNRRL